jgi:CBS domain-containing protein
MKTVRDLLQSKKSSTVWSIRAKDAVYDALGLMRDKEVGALIVMDDQIGVAGILSERDYARKIVLLGKSSKDTPVEDIMTPLSDLYKVKPENSVEDCMVLMTAKKVRHLPVFEDNTFVGIISIGDVVKSIIAEQESLIEQLSNYISGKYV